MEGAGALCRTSEGQATPCHRGYHESAPLPHRYTLGSLVSIIKRPYRGQTTLPTAPLAPE